MNELNTLYEKLLYTAVIPLLKIFLGFILAVVFIISIRYIINQKRSPIKYKIAGNISGIIFGKSKMRIAFSPHDKEGHIIAFGGSGVGKTSALLIPTLRSWKGSSFTIDISGDISRNVSKENKIVFDPENKNTIPYNAFYYIDTLNDINEQNQALEKLAFLLVPDLVGREATTNAKFFNDEGRKILTASLIAFYHTNLDFVEICEKIILQAIRNYLQKLTIQKIK